MLHKNSDEVKQDKPGVNTYKNSPNWLDRSIGTSILSSGSDSVSSRESNHREKQRAFPGLDFKAQSLNQ